jgi:serine/threonine-protein kinase
MAEIFLARHKGPGGFDKELVVKMLQPRWADHPRVVSMFRDEARIGARLNHPNIVDIFDVGEADGAHFIAMEFIEGRTLTELIRRGLEVSRPLPLALAAALCAEVAEGLAYMHDGTDRHGKRLGVVHRDISPTNIIISDRGQVKIIDFGIATDHGDIKEEDSTMPGKWSYMSPEQVQGRRLDGRSDVFSLGVILYEITVGQRLYRGRPEVVMKRIVEERIRPPTFVNRGYPPSLELIVMRALEKAPADRYASADDMAQDLEAFVAEAVGPAGVAGARQLSSHIRHIDDPGAVVTESGARKAAAFAGEYLGEEDAAPLNLDPADAPWRVAGPEPEPLAEKLAEGAPSSHEPGPSHVKPATKQSGVAPAARFPWAILAICVAVTFALSYGVFLVLGAR